MVIQFTYNMSSLIADIHWGLVLAGSREQGLGCDLHPPHSTQHTRRSAANNRRRPPPGKFISSNMQAPKFYVGSKNLNAEHAANRSFLSEYAVKRMSLSPKTLPCSCSLKALLLPNACQSSEQGIRGSEK